MELINWEYCDITFVIKKDPRQGDEVFTIVSDEAGKDEMWRNRSRERNLEWEALVFLSSAFLTCLECAGLQIRGWVSGPGHGQTFSTPLRVKGDFSQRLVDPRRLPQALR